MLLLHAAAPSSCLLYLPAAARLQQHMVDSDQLHHAGLRHDVRLDAARALAHHHTVAADHQADALCVIKYGLQYAAALHAGRRVHHDGDGAAVQQARLGGRAAVPLGQLRHRQQRVGAAGARGLQAGVAAAALDGRAARRHGELGRVGVGAHHGEDGLLRLVLGQQARGAARDGEAHNHARVHLVGGAHRGGGQRLGAVHLRRQREEAALVHERPVVAHVVKHLLGRAADGAHRAHRLHRVLAAEGLRSQQHAVSAVQHQVGHVGGLRARGARRLRHGVHHARHKHGLAHGVGAVEQHLLRQEHLLRLQRHAKRAAAEHHCVRRLHNLLVPHQALNVLQARDDAHRGGEARAREHGAARAHVSRAVRVWQQQEVARAALGRVQRGPAGQQRLVSGAQRGQGRADALLQLHRQLRALQHARVVHHAVHARGLHLLHSEVC
mmetsp:Transcript_22978/g.58772  ORF Transcript_22978/g.58772 Transcript_22978/m.58772 type:complete len:439 (-) Transcript_22978:511-1827(-)